MEEGRLELTISSFGRSFPRFFPPPPPSPPTLTDSNRRQRGKKGGTQTRINPCTLLQASSSISTADSPSLPSVPSHVLLPPPCPLVANPPSLPIAHRSSPPLPRPRSLPRLPPLHSFTFPLLLPSSPSRAPRPPDGLVLHLQLVPLAASFASRPREAAGTGNHWNCLVDASYRDGIQEGETAVARLGGGRVISGQGRETARSQRREHGRKAAQAGYELLLLV